MGRKKSEMLKLEALLTALETHAPQHDKLNPLVSKASVGWQIDHSLKVINSVLNALQKSDPSAYRPAFNLKKLYFLTLRRIPRGKVKAPKSVQSYDVVTLTDLKRQLQTARQLTKESADLPDYSHFTHPFLGQFKRSQAVAFLETHTHHHLKIILDIIKKS